MQYRIIINWLSSLPIAFLKLKSINYMNREESFEFSFKYKQLESRACKGVSRLIKNMKTTDSKSNLNCYR